MSAKHAGGDSTFAGHGSLPAHVDVERAPVAPSNDPAGATATPAGSHTFGEMAHAALAYSDEAVWQACLLANDGSTGRRHVYFAVAPVCGAVKIGSSGRPLQRIEQLSSGSPERLTLAALLPDAGYEGERRLHRTLAQSRIHGEWFLLTPHVLAAIEAVQA